MPSPCCLCRSGLEGKKVEAEAYIDKQAERLKWHITGNTLLQRDKEVRTQRTHCTHAGSQLATCTHTEHVTVALNFLFSSAIVCWV